MGNSEKAIYFNFHFISILLFPPFFFLFFLKLDNFIIIIIKN